MTILLYFIWIPNSHYNYNNLLYSNRTTAKVQHFCCTQKICTFMLRQKCRTCWGSPSCSPLFSYDRLYLLQSSRKMYNRFVVLLLYLMWEYNNQLYTTSSCKNYNIFVVLESLHIYPYYTTICCNKYNRNVPGNVVDFTTKIFAVEIQVINKKIGKNFWKTIQG